MIAHAVTVVSIDKISMTPNKVPSELPMITAISVPGPVYILYILYSEMTIDITNKNV